MRYFCRILIVTGILGCMLSAACKKETARPLTEYNPKVMDINEFAAWFADMASKNQRDSIYLVYQDILKADSISFTREGRPFRIKELGDGIYEIRYSPESRILVKKDDEGNLSVTGSFGLFAFDEGRKALAKKGGMISDSLTDVQASERMKDEGFFTFLESKGRIRTSDILEIGSPVYNSNDRITGETPIFNLTDFEVDGNDYSIAMFSQTMANGQEENRIFYEPGRTILPGDSIHVRVVNSPQQVVRVNDIKFKLTQEQLAEKFAPLTGREYQEYLETKGGK